MPEENSRKRKSGITICVLIIACVVLVCSPLIRSLGKSFQIRNQIIIGNRFLDEGDFERAVLSFQKVVDLDPQDWNACKGLALAYAGSRDYGAEADLLTGCAEIVEETGAQEDQEELKRLVMSCSGNLLVQSKSELDSGSSESAIGIYNKVLDLYSDADVTSFQITEAENLMNGEEANQETLEKVQELLEESQADAEDVDLTVYTHTPSITETVRQSMDSISSFMDLFEN